MVPPEDMTIDPGEMTIVDPPTPRVIDVPEVILIGPETEMVCAAPTVKESAAAILIVRGLRW